MKKLFLSIIVLAGMVSASEANPRVSRSRVIIREPIRRERIVIREPIRRERIVRETVILEDDCHRGDSQLRARFFFSY